MPRRPKLERLVVHKTYNILKCPKCGWQYPAPMTEPNCVRCGTPMEHQLVYVNPITKQQERTY